MLNTQLDELSTLAELLRVNGEIGQPRLRHCCHQLHVMLDRDANLLVLFVLCGSVSDVAKQLDDLDCSAESILSDTLDELEQLLESANVRAEVDAFVLVPDIDSDDAPQFADSLPRDQTVYSGNIRGFPANSVDEPEPLSEEVFTQLGDLLFPKRQWKRVQLVQDEGRLIRRERRVELEKELLATSWGLNAATTLIEGGPGSGKSLLLVSRACWLASAVPNGRILLVTWNKSLAAALRQWLNTFSVGTVDVLPLADFFARHRIELNLADPADADARCQQLLERRTFKSGYDAILVDEAQDLGGILLDLLRRFLKPSSGGLTLAMDSSQNLRRRPPIELSKLPQPLESINLTRCHRSTDVIRRFSYAFAGYEIPESSGNAAENEELVRMVWAETVEECTDMIVCEASRLIRDVGVTANEIMIVAFDGRQRRAIVTALEAAGHATSAPTKSRGSDAEICIASPEVAKGHEASCVFIVGWDSMAAGSESCAARRFVACSRAADVLYVLYTSQEGLGLSEDADSLALKQLWPDDFEVVQEDE